MEEVLYLQESPQIVDIISAVRSELTNAVRTALVQGVYDTDIQLSFGAVHINSKGSVSQISFGGTDVADMDAFIVQQALHISDDNYFDIRAEIRENIEEFCFYPIKIGNKISLTVLKSSPYFEKMYGAGLHYDDIRVEYAFKYLIIYKSNWDKPDVYLIGSFSPEATANLLLEDAGKTYGGKEKIYYCYMNSRPEMFLHLGKVKSDFVAYHPEKNPDIYNFYIGSIIAGIFKNNKKTNSNGQIEVRKTQITCFKLIIKMQYGTVEKFCEVYGINSLLMTGYLSGASTEIKYLNGNKLTPTRLAEILNLPIEPNEENLKDRNLLIKVDYNDIPS